MQEQARRLQWWQVYIEESYQRIWDRVWHRPQSLGLIYQSRHDKNKPFLLTWITMYNEPPWQLIESLLGMYRTYYELVESNKDFVGKVQVVIIIDGYDIMSEEDLSIYK